MRAPILSLAARLIGGATVRESRTRTIWHDSPWVDRARSSAEICRGVRLSRVLFLSFVSVFPDFPSNFLANHHSIDVEMTFLCSPRWTTNDRLKVQPKNTARMMQEITDQSSRTVLLNTFVVKKKRCKVYFHRGTLIWETEKPPYSKQNETSFIYLVYLDWSLIHALKCRFIHREIRETIGIVLRDSLESRYSNHSWFRIFRTLQTKEIVDALRYLVLPL